MKFSWAKLVVSVVLVVWWFAMPQVGFPDDRIIGHSLYWLSHANVWHLAANVLCLWMIPCELHLMRSVFVAVVCSFLPCLSVSVEHLTCVTISEMREATCGFSGVLFAVVGMSWGRVNRFKDMLWRNKWWLLIPLFIPHVNALLHVYCMVAGWLVGRCDRITAHSKGDWV